MPQVHIIGEIASAEEFAVCSTVRPLMKSEPKLKCVWELQTKEDSWTLLQGCSKGVSSLCVESFKQPVAWTQPIDAHFSTTSLRGWPKLFLEVWHEDEYGRCELSGYGMVHVPSAPGEYDLECVTWLPKGSLREEIYKYFLGYVPRLEQPGIVTKPSSRFDLFARSSGRVSIKLNVLGNTMSIKYGSGDFGFKRMDAPKDDGEDEDHDENQDQDQDQDERSYLLSDLAKKKEVTPPKPVDDNGALAAGGLCTCCCCCMIVFFIIGGFLYRFDELQKQPPVVIVGAVFLAFGGAAFLCVCMSCFLACFLNSISNLNPTSSSSSDEIKLELKRLNDKYEKEKSRLESLRLDLVSSVKSVKDAKKKESKRRKDKVKQRKEEIERQVTIDLETGLSVRQVRKKARPCAFRIDFEGDMQVSSIETLREQISCVIKIGAPQYDQVVVLVTSPGGSVTMYGLAAAQLIRIKKAGFKLVICVDSIAASGGYLMSSVADEIYSAPFALLGSIGVISIVPNVNDLLEKHDVHTHVFTAGKYKSTVNVVGEISEEGKKKFKEELEEIHTVFKDHIALHRPGLKDQIEDLATGEAFLGVEAKQKGLVDHILTSDEYFERICADFDIIAVKQKPKHSIISEFWENMYNPDNLGFKKVFQQYLGQPALL